MNTHATRHALTTMMALVLSASTTHVAAQAPAATSSIPAAVLNAFHQAYPAATITRTSQERDRNRPVTRVESVDKGRQRVVLYGENNAVVEVAEQVNETELPQPVAAAMHSHPRAMFVAGRKVTRGANVQYQLTLKGTRKTAMIVAPDGTVVDFR